MGIENIFDIWKFIGKGTPFIVRRNRWYHLSYKVTKVIPKWKYGEAYGCRLIDGKFEVDTPQEEPIACCDSGNWELIENLIEDVETLHWNCIDANNNLTFGKYKGMNVKEIKSKDENYFKWAWANVGGLSEILFTREYNVSLQDLLSIKKQIKEALNFTSDDWIKSPVKNNFDFILDQYKYACCAKQKDIATAVKEIEHYYKQCKAYNIRGL